MVDQNTELGKTGSSSRKRTAVNPRAGHWHAMSRSSTVTGNILVLVELSSRFHYIEVTYVTQKKCLMKNRNPPLVSPLRYAWYLAEFCRIDIRQLLAADKLVSIDVPAAEGRL